MSYCLLGAAFSIALKKLIKIVSFVEKYGTTWCRKRCRNRFSFLKQAWDLRFSSHVIQEKLNFTKLSTSACLLNSVLQLFICLTRYGRRYTTISTMMLSGVSCGSVAFIPGDTDVPGTVHIVLYDKVLCKKTVIECSTY